jgi:uncharacterized membrane-anchored protein
VIENARRLGPHEVLALIGLIIALAAINFAIYQKEKVLSSGVSIKLALAPRDPRALLTGDYMALTTAIEANINSSADRRRIVRRDGFVIVKSDDRGISQFVRVQDAPDVQGVRDVRGGLGTGELAVKFRDRGGDVRVGPNAFYFQEGLAAAFALARFGEYRLAANGELVLVQMLDEQLRVIDGAMTK